MPIVDATLQQSLPFYKSNPQSLTLPKQLQQKLRIQAQAKALLDQQ